MALPMPESPAATSWRNARSTTSTSRSTSSWRRCRLVVAAKKETTLAGGGRKITIATKYPRLARAYFNPRGIRADFVKLNGTMELAPLVRLADAIVDLADTGDTLRANGLEEKAVIRQVSARLIVNRIAARRNPLVGDLQNCLRTAIDG